MNNKYEDYIPMDFSRNSSNSMSEMIIYDATRDDMDTSGKTPESVKYLQDSRTFLKSEVLFCYEFMKRKGILEEYRKFRNSF